VSLTYRTALDSIRRFAAQAQARPDPLDEEIARLRPSPPDLPTGFELPALGPVRTHRNVERELAWRIKRREET
jgi:hypothetical protein